MKVVAIVQARMGSTRLPGKVMRSLAGHPMIHHVLERVGRIADVEDVVVATSDRPLDDPLVEYLMNRGGTRIFRGSENDVLARFAGAAQDAGAGAVVRVTADCPLLCPSVSGRVVEEFRKRSRELDYVSNTITRTFPRGLDTEIFSTSVLYEAHRDATDASDREHVTPFIWRQPERFRLGEIRDSQNRCAYRWTVDTQEDFELVERVYGELFQPSRSAFDYQDILSCLEAHPDWVGINQGVPQRLPGG